MAGIHVVAIVLLTVVCETKWSERSTPFRFANYSKPRHINAKMTNRSNPDKWNCRPKLCGSFESSVLYISERPMHKDKCLNKT